MTVRAKFTKLILIFFLNFAAVPMINRLAWLITETLSAFQV